MSKLLGNRRYGTAGLLLCWCLLAPNTATAREWHERFEGQSQGASKSSASALAKGGAELKAIRACRGDGRGRVIDKDLDINCDVIGDFGSAGKIWSCSAELKVTCEEEPKK